MEPQSVSQLSWHQFGPKYALAFNSNSVSLIWKFVPVCQMPAKMCVKHVASVACCLAQVVLQFVITVKCKQNTKYI